MTKATDVIRYMAVVMSGSLLIASYVIEPKVGVTMLILGKSLYAELPSNFIYTSIYVSLAALLLLVYSIPEYRVWRINNMVNNELPSFIRVLRDSVSAGLTTTEFVAMLSKYGMRTLTRLIMNKVKHGVLGPGELSSVLMELSHELNNSTLESLSIILNSILRSGVKAGELLDLTYRELDNVTVGELDKVSSLRPYIALAYGITVIYVLLGSIVLAGLIPRLITTGIGATGSLPLGVTSPTIFINVLNALFVYSIFIQSLLIGLIVGRVVYRSIGAGLMHSSIITVTAVAANYIFHLYTPYILHV